MAAIVALSLTALIGATGLAVDVGDVFLAARRLQGTADLAAMSAAQGLAPGVGDDAAASAAAQSAATATVNVNGWPEETQTRVDVGVYVPDSSVAPVARFHATPASPNAARVTLTTPVPLVFAGLLLGRSSLNVSRAATSARAELAAFSIGSGLVAVSGGLPNAVLSAVTGSQVQLSVMDYQALASANVSLLDYVSALSTRLNLTGASYNQVLGGSVSGAAALSALSDVLGAAGYAQAASAARAVAAASPPSVQVPLSALFDLGAYGAQDHGSPANSANVVVNAGALMNAMLLASNGQRQVVLNLGSTVPGLTALSVQMAIGQRPSHSPWITVTDSDQVIVRTAQTRIYIQAGLAPTALTGPVGVAVFAEAASAQAKLAAMRCPADPAAQSATLMVLPSLGELALGQVDPSTLGDFSTPERISPVVLVDTPLLRATGTSLITLGGGSNAWTPVAFSRADIASGAVKTVTTQDIAQATIASLLAKASFQVQTPVIGFGLGPGPATAALQAALSPAAGVLDSVLDQLTQTAGVQLGRADVWMDGLRCNGAALVG